MTKPNIYEKILDLYKTNLDEWRIFLYENMGLLMRKNPLLKHNFVTYTSDDIKSEAFMFADAIILREDIDDVKKISKLWYLFNRGGWQLYNIVTQYNAETYNTDDLKNNELLSEEVVDDVFIWVLVNNNIITPLEAQILEYKSQWMGKYEIARQMKTTYYNVRAIMDTIALKIIAFLDRNNIEDAGRK